MTKIKHTWTMETMDKCRKVFIEAIQYYYFNLTDDEFKKKYIYELIEHYSKIEKDIGNE